MGILNRLFSYEYINKEHLEGLDRYKVINKKKSYFEFCEY